MQNLIWSHVEGKLRAILSLNIFTYFTTTILQTLVFDCTFEIHTLIGVKFIQSTVLILNDNKITLVNVYYILIVFPGCPTDWDDIYCWHRANVGQVIRVSCTNISKLFADNQAYVSRNCTEKGWSELLDYHDTCVFKDVEEQEPVVRRYYYVMGKHKVIQIYLFSLCRKFHCTRNYIHINLFFSFILRATAVFVKDLVLFSDADLDHCFMSTTACKSAVAFFQFSILANYFWLLVEGMYLQTLLALTFVFQKKYFWWYILIGWGGFFCYFLKFTAKLDFMHPRCWDDTDVAFIWWIIKGPITASLLVNFIIFLNVIRILVQKLTSPGVGGNNTSHFKRLAKSTLLLIPLFGMHYMVFAFLPENTGAEARIIIEVGMGSFQGFVVALLYCFLNGEVSTCYAYSLF
uniref:Growth hormone releasing hormone receptor b n=1 Tax=Poecilia latipinna TaxID=48699 RepID=A0A3B3TKL6_9TELE